MAEARENDENFKSPLDLLFLHLVEGKRYIPNEGGAPAPSMGISGLSRNFGTGNATGDSDWSWEPTNLKRNSDGVRPADCGGLSPDEDFALMNYKNFKVAAGKTLKSIIISCNVRLAPIATAGVRSLLEYDEMELDTLGDPDAKVAVFGILSDTDKTLSFLFAIMMWQCIDQLCRKALLLDEPPAGSHVSSANLGRQEMVEGASLLRGADFALHVLKVPALLQLLDD